MLLLPALVRRLRPEEIAASVLFTALTVAAVAGLGPVTHNDSMTYLNLRYAARGERLWTVPLLYRVLPGNDARVIVQTAIACAAWPFAAIALARAIRSRILGGVGLVAVCVLGLTQHVTRFHTAILAESIALSLGVLVFGCGLVHVRRRTRRTVAALALATFAWAFSRHVHVFIVGLQLLLLIPAALAVARRPAGRLSLRYAGALTVIVLAALPAVLAQGQVARYNSTALLFDRVLPASGGADFIAERGLVLREDQRGFVGNFAPNWPALSEDDELARWIRTRWRGAYLSWLAAHPRDAIATPLDHAGAVLTADPVYGESRRVLPQALQRAAYTPSPSGLRLLLFVTAVVAGAATPLLWRRRRRHAAFLAVLVTSTAGWYYVVWLLSSTELQRLMLPVGMGLRLTALAAVLISVDAVAERVLLRDRGEIDGQPSTDTVDVGSPSLSLRPAAPR